MRRPCLQMFAAGLVAGWVIALGEGRALGGDRGVADGIHFANDALTVHLSDAAVADVLAELSRQSAAEIRGELKETKGITADFDGVPLAQALARLLPDQNFALVYGRGGHLKMVRLFGGTQTIVLSQPDAGAQTSPQDALLQVISRHPPVHIEGVLADALGTGSATLPQLLDLSLDHEDANVRAEAVRTGMAVIEGEPELLSAVLGELRDIDNAALTTLLRASSSQADDVARRVLVDAQLPAIRLKASAVLQRLRIKADAP